MVEIFIKFELQKIRGIEVNSKFVKSKYFSKYKQSLKLKISRPTRLELEHKVLKLFDYKIPTTIVKHQIQESISEIVSIDNDPVFIFKEIVCYLQKNRIVLPGYTILQEMIGKAITAEEKRLASLLNKFIKKDIQKTIVRIKTKAIFSY